MDSPVISISGKSKIAIKVEKHHKPIHLLLFAINLNRLKKIPL
jgi:hypothetical protein